MILFSGICNILWAGMAQSVQRLATGRTVWGSNPGGGEISATVETGPGAHPASCTIGTESFQGIKRPVRDVGHPPLPSAEVNERVQPYIFTPPLDFRGLF